MGTQDYLDTIVSIATLLGMIFIVYDKFRNSDNKMGRRLDVIETRCPITHKNIDKDISSIHLKIRTIEENHLTHMERDMQDVKQKLTKILTILEYNEHERIEP